MKFRVRTRMSEGELERAWDCQTTFRKKAHDIPRNNARYSDGKILLFSRNKLSTLSRSFRYFDRSEDGERERERGRSDDLKGSRMGFDGVESGWKFGNFAGFDAKRGGKWSMPRQSGRCLLDEADRSPLWTAWRSRGIGWKSICRPTLDIIRYIRGEGLSFLETREEGKVNYYWKVRDGCVFLNWFPTRSSSFSVRLLPSIF